MVLLAPAVWFSRIVTFVLSGLAAGCAVYWALQWSVPMRSAPVVTVDAPQQLSVEMPAVEKALGGMGVAPVADNAGSSKPLLASRFVLAGVVAGTHQVGAALIGVDGKPPRPFELGTRVGDDWVLQSVQGRRAVLVRRVDGAAPNAPSDGPAGQLVLDMPPVNKDKKP